MLALEALRRKAEQASDLTEEPRRRAERCRDYYDNNQWTTAEKSVLKKRKQPIVGENLVRRKVDSLVGLEMQGRVDPRALPRMPDDQQAADLATMALVFVDDISRFDATRSAVAYNMAIEGYGGVEVTVRQRGGNVDPDIIKLRWEEIFYDPFSREADFSDASYMGVQKWLHIDAAIEYCRPFAPETPEDELREKLEASLTLGGSTYDDRPNGESAWGDSKSKRVKLAYMYYRSQGQWFLALFCGGGEIYNQPSPYLDEEGQPANAIILQSCYVDRDNGRTGIVYDWLSLQDEVNKRRSKILHMLNSRQTMGHRGAIVAPDGVDPIQHLKREMALPDGHIEYDQDPTTNVPGFQIIPQADQIAGQFQLLADAKQAIQMLGPNASLQGQLEGKHSGRAIMAQQQAGMAELAPFYDAIRDFTLRVYRAVWMRVRQYWTGPRWIRVTDETEGLQFVGINMPAVNQMGQLEVQNRVAELDVDIIIDAAPDYATLQQEQFEMLTQLATSTPGLIPPDLIIEASQLRDKQKILERLRDPEAQQQQQALQQRMAQLEDAMRQAKVASEQAAAQQKSAAANKLAAETQEIMAGMGDPNGTIGDGRMRLMLDARKQEAAEIEKGRKLSIEEARAGAEIEHKRAQTAEAAARAQKAAIETMPPVAVIGVERR